MIIAESRIGKNFRITIPKEIREAFDIDENTIVEWGINDNGEPAINFRKKVELEDVIGIVESEDKTDSVSLKKDLYR